MKSFTNIVKRSAYLFCALFVALVMNNIETYALDPAVLDMYAQNNIMFYDPDACATGGSSGSTTLAGNNTIEKMWNYYVGKGFNDAQTAGILGNAFVESGFTITRASNSSYWGLFQWYKEYVPKLIQNINDAGLGKYMDSQYWPDGGDESIPEGDRDALLQILLDYTMDESTWLEDWGEIIKQKNGDAHEPEYAAEVFLVHYERAIGGTEPLLYYNSPLSSAPYQGTITRREKARELFEQYSGTSAPTGSTSGLSITDGSNVTWIGDSLTAIWVNTLKEMLPQVEVDARSSRSWNHDSDSGGPNGMSILDGVSSVRDIFVWELGTNDWNITDEQMDYVHSTAVAKGAKIMLVMTAYKGGVDYSSATYNHYNTKIKQYADEHSDVLLADWFAMVDGHESEYLLPDDRLHEKDEGAAKKFFQLFIDTVNNSTDAFASDTCCDPRNGSDGSDAIWAGTKYEITDAQTKGLLSMIMKENGETVTQVKTQASQMANRFEIAGSSYGSGVDGIINYVRTSHWYDSNTGAAYDENYNGSDEYLKAVKEVIAEGKRNIPKEVVQHATRSTEYIKASNDGIEFDVNDTDKFKSGTTKIEELFGDGATWIFYAWADPEQKSGDPFGYEQDKPPAGNSEAGAKAKACCAKTIGGITKKEIDGHEYAFPLAGATKANYLRPSTFNSDGTMRTVLSELPCPSYSCHHDYHALDMGVMMEMISGSEASNYGGTDGDLMYFSSGAPVVAFTSGTISYAKSYSNGVPSDWWDKCGQIGLQGDDGNFYWLGHMDQSFEVSDGDHVEAGQVLAKVGAPQCAQNTQGHLHIENSNGAKSDTWTIEVMNELWEALPDSESGSGVTSCGSSELPAGGYTSVDDADEEVMRPYRELPSPQTEDPWDLRNNDFPAPEPNGCGASLANCVEFSLYFINRYTTAHFTGLPSGARVVPRLLESDQGFIDGGHEPKPYAIFSVDSGSHGGDGHTGVVLGIDEARGKIILGEAGCGESVDWIGAHEDNLELWRNNPNTRYAYTDNILK